MVKIVSNNSSIIFGIDCLCEDERPEKRFKGNSLVLLPCDYTIIDIETTGLYMDCKIIELSAIRVKNNAIVDSFTTLVNPEEEIDSFISKLTGITNEMVANQPLIEDALPKFVNFIGEDIVIGHNVNFDINVINKNYYDIKNVPFTNDFVDTLRLCRLLWKEEKHNRLKDLIKRFNLKGEQEHRSLSDCNYVYEILQHIGEYVSNNQIDIETLSKRKHSNKGQKLSLKDVIASISLDSINTDNPFYDKNVVFTGTLEKYTRQVAAQIVVNCGGKCQDNLTKDTDYLVVADLGFREKTSKIVKAEEYKLKGRDIEVIPESLFYEMLSDYVTE